MSNCSAGAGGWVCADAAATMQAVESQTLILYHTDLRGQWPAAAAGALAARLPYGKRLALGADEPQQHASLAGIALALRALSLEELFGRCARTTGRGCATRSTAKRTA